MPKNNQAGVKMSSRIRELMDQSIRYSFDGRSRLIADTGISRSEMTRLLSGDCNPSYRVVTAVVDALEKALGRTIDSREVLSFSGDFPTATICELVSCRGCPKCKPYQPVPPARSASGGPGTEDETRLEIPCFPSESTR